MKTFDKKDIYTIVTEEEVKAYIGKLGYFGDSLEELEEKINKDDCDELAEVVHENYTSNAFRPRGYDSAYGLFLPNDKVKKEKKYRPFKTIAEIIKTLLISFGDPIRFRHKNNPKMVQIGIFNGYCEKGDKLDYITIGAWICGIQSLFDYYEFYDNKTKEWRTFGVEE